MEARGSGVKDRGGATTAAKGVGNKGPPPRERPSSRAGQPMGPRAPSSVPAGAPGVSGGPVSSAPAGVGALSGAESTSLGYLQYRALYLFPAGSALRTRLDRMVRSRAFRAVSLGLILLNLVALAAFDPVAAVRADRSGEDHSGRNAVLQWADLVFLSLFTVELGLRYVGGGG
jgi:hypothetical protein